MAYDRYELYKRASSVAQAISLGANKGDIKFDLAHGYLTQVPSPAISMLILPPTSPSTPSLIPIGLPPSLLDMMMSIIHKSSWTVNAALRQPGINLDKIVKAQIKELVGWKEVEGYLPITHDKMKAYQAEGVQVLPTKWVITAKFPNMEEAEIEVKARCTLRGDLDFREDIQASSPTIFFDTIRLLLGLAGTRTVIIVDVKQAYMQASPSKATFLVRPPILANGQPYSEEQFWLILKALYGGRESGFLWFLELTSTLVTMGYTSSSVEPCVYYKQVEGKTTSVIGILVDDLLGIGDTAVYDLQKLPYKCGKLQVLSQPGDHTNYGGVNITKTTTGYTIDVQKHEQ